MQGGVGSKVEINIQIRGFGPAARLCLNAFLYVPGPYLFIFNSWHFTWVRDYLQVMEFLQCTICSLCHL